MRIAFHNPWVNSSENQAYMSMAEAGRRIGVELVACLNEGDIEACRPDFVVTVASSVAKIADYPTYLTVHEPKALFLEQPARMRNLFSFDGYLTISESLARFVKDFCAGVGRPEEPGFFYLTPQVSDLHCHWDRADRADRLKLVYFGTNWNRRNPLLFRALDPMGILSIRGPEKSWAVEGYASYDGPAAFDGTGPQLAYAEAGLGLALMDERWQREDVISNRIFEISSVGAVSICPDMPWTRKWFGDCVFYYDPLRPMREVAEQVRAHHATCRARPDVARAMGAAARRIFETHFSAERLLANAVEYHQRKMAARMTRRAALPPPPRISVVLRCGGRELAFLRRAVDSIRRQSHGRFTVILAKYRDIDVGEITAPQDDAIESFDEFLIDGGGRAEMLWAGLRRVATPYFAVLDDDDFWMSDHFEALFEAGRRVDAAFDMAFSGQIEFDQPSRYNYGAPLSYRNIGRFGYSAKLAGAWQLGKDIGTNCFVARSDLLPQDLLDTPDMRSAEDSLLITLAARRSKPVFSWRATAFYRPNAPDGSNWEKDDQRLDDELSFAMRAGLMFSPRWLVDGGFDATEMIWRAGKHKPGSGKMGEQMDRLLAGPAGRAGPRGIEGRPGIVGFVSEGPQAKLNPGRYLAVFLITPNGSDEATAEGERAGTVEIVVAAPDGAVLGRCDFAGNAAELVLQFAIDDTMVNGPLELRVFSHGTTPFTVASVGVHKDFSEPAPDRFEEPPAVAPTPPVAPPLPIAPSAPAARPDVDALRAELAAIHRSTSWRLTRPLRRAARMARAIVKLTSA